MKRTNRIKTSAKKRKKEKEKRRKKRRKKAQFLGAKNQPKKEHCTRATIEMTTPTPRVWGRHVERKRGWSEGEGGRGRGAATTKNQAGVHRIRAECKAAAQTLAPLNGTIVNSQNARQRQEPSAG